MHSIGKILACLLLLGFAGGTLTACEDTWHGFGQDVEDVGENIQE